MKLYKIYTENKKIIVTESELKTIILNEVMLEIKLKKDEEEALEKLVKLYGLLRHDFNHSMWVWYDYCHYPVNFEYIGELEENVGTIKGFITTGEKI